MLRGANVRQVLGGIVVLALVCTSSEAALQSRLAGRAYYDTLLGITWIADGNLIATRSFGVSGIGTGTSGYGAVDWSTAQEWVAAMNAAGYLGVSDWRLPRVIDTDGPDADGLGDDGCDLAYAGTDCGWNVDPGTGELAHLYYVTLGNPGAYDPYGVHQDWCDTGMPAPPACLINVGPFSNFFPNHYWTATEFAIDSTDVWEFNARIGAQNINVKTRLSYAWAVRDGDIGDVPMSDADNDGVADVVDNCTLVANASQCDSDGDGFGNHCDGDLNNNGFTNAFDTALFRAQLGRPSVPPTYNQADFNCNGFVNSLDTVRFRQLLERSPGPSALVP